MDKTTFYVSGLAVHVYGLTHVRDSKVPLVDVVFILHGRTQTYLPYEPFASSILAAEHAVRPQRSGVIVVLFDQRNHGHREVSAIANVGWEERGQFNPFHAQDTYTHQYGTAQDVSMLITFLPMYLFPNGEASFANILCGGISLGGHSTYLVLSDDDRVKAGFPIIGCPDIKPLMIERSGDKVAERCPPSYLAIVEKLDPKVEKVAKKDLLILYGKKDKIVPFSAGEKFVSALPAESTEVVGFAGVGHAFPDVMMHKAVDWISKWRQAH